MSTDITRWPKICPSCGKENPPTAARCWLCFTPLGEAFQTTTAFSPGEVRLSAPPRTEPTAVARSDCASVAAWTGVAILTIVSAGVTFFLTCLGTVYIQNGGRPSMFPAGVAAVAVATLIIVVFLRVRRR
jgi:hypothetical protein